ncbi:hypothetical protein [Devosia nitrariae]|uniref:Glycosyltransferase RgtA/B/C/D-like domain-containing protein n=1 Tax=Devosia nitrariae TaxID=2071872 RepID=A0ABQ5W1T5_9HYPH|nr:hypothetical protein [Devosia nitrariae]GLQ53952.1 hypothetical protein GCM10010862_12110 [Devosia nitrariae]
MNDRFVAVIIFCLAFWAFIWLSPQDSGAQVVTRLGLTLSIVEDGQLTIDKVAARTIDKAKFGGQFYADKTPGLSFLAIPVVAAARTVFAMLGWSTDWTDPQVFDRYAVVATIGTNCLVSALAVALVFLVARRLGAPSAGAVFAAGALALGTPFLGWSTAFFSHSVSGSLLVIALALVFLAANEKRLLLWGAAGVVLGYCAVVELTTAPAAMLIGLLALGLAARGGNLVACLCGLAIGGTIGAMPLVLYNQLAFGDPFVLGYANVVGFEGMQQGFFGVGLPDPAVIAELLFGTYRGLLPLSPILLLAPFGLVAMARRQDTRAVAVIVMLAFISQLAINAGYVYWNGGWSVGPRHLVPALPLLALALAFAWPREGAARMVALTLLFISLAISLICAGGGMSAPGQYRNPLLEWVLPRFSTPEALLRSAPVLMSWAGFGWLLWRADSVARPHIIAARAG